MAIEETLAHATRCFRRGELGAAEALLSRVLAENPRHAEALHYLGVCCYRRGDCEAAVTHIRAALEVDNSSPYAHSNLGLALKRLQRLDEAIASFDAAIARAPGVAAFRSNRGLAYAEMRRFDAAQADFGKAVELDPNMAEAHSNRGKALIELGRFDAALEHIDRAIALRPDLAEAHCNRALAYRETSRFAEAMESCKRVIEIDPGFPNMAGYWLHDMMRACAWDDLALARARVLQMIDADEPAADPFVVLGIPSTPAQQQRCARCYRRGRFPASKPWSEAERNAHDRIRIGYFSADFHNHAIAHLIAELLERHDRARFEIIGFSYGPERHDAWRRRIEKAVDRMVECASYADEEIAGLARQTEIDIAVDLMGYTRNARPGIFAFRPAPIQVNYLGFPGTMGMDCIDYIIADSTLIPASEETAYDEKVVYMPHSYQANDSTKLISDKPVDRVGHGLPEDGFVYCCFNNNHKISPEVFDIWMRLLRANERSVLWLFAGNPAATENLRKEAGSRGVAPGRLIFAPRRELSEHLARHRLADLFLDTFYYNAHTTASDALWAGLPVITRLGDTFAGRVAASLLRALDLPELVTETEAQYEALALHLTRNPEELAAIREKLARHRTSRPLFDAAGFAADIETAYHAMWDRYRTGLPPDRIVVARCRGDA
jgi:predicted O-linked N-acetylglucosamine transferase (SPINDLY family)